MAELYEMTLAQVREGLQKKEFSVTDAVKSCLARIEETEPKLNACISVLAESALARAAELDAQGPEDLPLWGVPVSLKDLICLKGFRNTCGSRMLENFKPFYDAEVAVRIKNSGAVIVAKNNMDEFAMGSGTETSYFGRTANPWDLGRVPGGSSGGSAAAVASGQCFASLGSDTGGSIRQPAGFCGCIGLKPTYGRVSRSGVVAYGSSYDQVGPITRSVEDCARVLEVIAGPDPKDSTSARLDLFPDNLPEQNFVEAALEGRCKDPDEIFRGMKIGIPMELWEAGITDEVRHACMGLLRRMEKHGAELTPVSLPRQIYAVATYYVMSSAEASTNLARFDGIRYGHRTENPKDLLDLYVASRSEGFGPEVQRRIMVGTFALSSGYYDAYYRKAAQVRRLMLGDFEAALEKCDFLAAPVAPETAWKFNRYESDPLKCYLLDLLTVSLNIVGMPGISLPAALGETSRMPVGLQLMGRPFGEAQLLRAAAAAENIAPRLGKPKAV